MRSISGVWIATTLLNMWNALKCSINLSSFWLDGASGSFHPRCAWTWNGASFDIMKHQHRLNGNPFCSSWSSCHIVLFVWAKLCIALSALSSQLFDVDGDDRMRTLICSHTNPPEKTRWSLWFVHPIGRSHLCHWLCHGGTTGSLCHRVSWDCCFGRVLVEMLKEVRGAPPNWP